MHLATAPSAFRPCIVGQHHLVTFGLTVVVIQPTVMTSRRTVKPGRNPRRGSNWQTWRCTQVLFGSVGAYFAEARRQLLGSWEAAVVCTDPRAPSREPSSALNRVGVSQSSQNLPGTRFGGCACHRSPGCSLSPAVPVCLQGHIHQFYRRSLAPAPRRPLLAARRLQLLGCIRDAGLSPELRSFQPKPAGSQGLCHTGVLAKARREHCLLLARVLCPAGASDEIRVYVLQKIFVLSGCQLCYKKDPLSSCIHTHYKELWCASGGIWSCHFPQQYSIIVSLEPAAQDPNLQPVFRKDRLLQN